MNMVGMAFNSTNPGVPFFDYLPPIESQFAYYASKGIKVLRFSISWEQAQNTLGGALNSTYMGYVDNAFTYAAAHGLKILLEVFGGAQYAGNKIGSAGGPTNANFADLWSRLSARYTGNSALWAYGLMNEPNAMPVPGVTWPAAAQAAITAIRLNDLAAYIYVCGENFAGAWNWEANNPTIQNLTDVSNKIVFEAHFYDDNDSSGTKYDWNLILSSGGDALDGGVAYPGTNGEGIGTKRLFNIITWAIKYSVKIAIGEHGTASQDNNVSWTNVLVNVMTMAQQYGIEIYYFAGTQFDESYLYYAGASTTIPGVDTTQMAVMTHFNGTAQPTNYHVINPPLYVAPSATSSAIKVFYRGYLAAPMTVTLSDNGAGGTFSAPTITLSAGYNPSATFTWTAPATPGYFKISFTNNISYTDPGAINLSSLSGSANFVEFFMMSDAATVQKDGSNILTHLFDKSGNSYDATPGPDGGPLVTTLGGKTVANFDGVNQLLMRNTAAGNVVSAGPRTLILVAAATSQGNNCLVHNANDSFGEQIQFNNDGGLYKIEGSGGQQAAIANRRTYDTNLHIIVVRVDDTTLGGTRMWVDGVLAPTLGQSPNFANHYQPRFGGNIFSPTHSPMNLAAWISLSTNATAAQINAYVNNIIIPDFGGTTWAITDPTIPAMVFGTQITDTTVNGDIVPAGVTSIMVELQASGGLSGGTRTDGFGSGSGSSGDFGKKYLTAVTAGATFPRYLADADSEYDAIAAGMVQHPGVQGNSSFGGAAPTIGTGGDVNLQGFAGNNLAGGATGGDGVIAPGPFTPNTTTPHNTDATGPGCSGGGSDNNGHMGKGGPAVIRYTDMTKAMLDENGNAQLNEDGTVKFNE